MKNIIFDNNELEFLKQVVLNGLFDYKNAKADKDCKELTWKFEKDFRFFSNKEVLWIGSFIQNWIYKNRENLEILFNKFYHKNPLFYLQVNNEDKELMKLNDLAFSIKKKINAKNIDFIKYNDVLSKIERLKKINSYMVSLSSEKPYKIYFLDLNKREFLKWELDSFFRFEQTKFVKIKDNEKQEFNRNVKYEKKELLNIFKTYDKKNDNMIFCEALLKY